MELLPFKSKPWNVPKKTKRYYSVSEITQTLRLIEELVEGNIYLIDYEAKKLHVAPSHKPNVLGYSKSYVMKKQLDFFDEILSENEKKWYLQVREACLKIFYAYPKDKRLDVKFSFCLIAKAANKKEVALHHTVVPCNLDDNGNWWRSLVFVRTKSFSEENKHYATITNSETGDVYQFLDGKFQLNKQKNLTDKEIKMLELLAMGHEFKEMKELLNVGKTASEKLRTGILEKLQAKNLTEAVAKAIGKKLIEV